MRRIGVFAAAVLLVAAGCGPGPRAQANPPRVQTRVVHFVHGDRPLPTTIWYATGPGGVGMAPGRRPIVLFSHGLGGLPEHFAPLLSSWARAGYVVVAPTYPHTNARAPVDRADVRRQPADAAYVVSRLLAGDLAPHLDGDRVAAVGFSAGGATTLGMFRPGHWPGLRAAVSVAGRRPPTPFARPGVPMLFVHGDRDPVVPVAAGRAAYDAAPGPKQFLAVPGAGHGQYLHPGDRQHRLVSGHILRFLRNHVPAAG